MSELEDLLIYLKSNNHKLFKRAARVTIKWSSNLSAVAKAKDLLDEGIKVDLLELESLVRPDKFIFPKTNIGLIGVKNED